MAGETTATRAEALLGAGRAALALGDTEGARGHLHDAHALVEDSSSLAWIENGLAVAAVLDADYERAQAHYANALRGSSGHPQITANFVRMLIASGRFDDAVRMYGAHDPSFWLGDDKRVLQRLINDARKQRSPSRGLDARFLLLFGVQLGPPSMKPLQWLIAPIGAQSTRRTTPLRPGCPGGPTGTRARLRSA